MSFDVLHVAAARFFRQILTRQALLQHVHQMDRIGRDFGLIIVEHRRQDLVRKARRHA